VGEGDTDFAGVVARSMGCRVQALAALSGSTNMGRGGEGYGPSGVSHPRYMWPPGLTGHNSVQVTRKGGGKQGSRHVVGEASSVVSGRAHGRLPFVNGSVLWAGQQLAPSVGGKLRLTLLLRNLLPPHLLPAAAPSKGNVRRRKDV